jgi:hypothetical protein
MGFSHSWFLWRRQCNFSIRGVTVRYWRTFGGGVVWIVLIGGGVVLLTWL